MLKFWLSQRHRSQICVFFLFIITLFVKNVFFHYECFHSILISSLLRDPITFISFYWNKIIPAIFIGSFIFISKKYLWTIIISILFDLWCISNLIYYQANECFLDVNTIFMVYNLDGFFSSIKTFIQPTYSVFLIITIIYAFCVHFIEKRNQGNRNIKSFIIVICFCILSHICSVIPSWKTQYYEGRYDIDFDIKNGRDVIIDTFGWKGYKMFIPFNDTKLNALPSSFDYNPDYAKDYINNTSIIHYFPAMIVYWLYSENDKSMVVDEKIINNFINTDNGKSITPNSNLIIILVESLESWSLEQGDLSTQAANNFLDFIGQDHILYCNSVRSQAKHGVSGDGQMIVNTGLLPVYAGAACMRFGDNTYPNIASNFNHSLLVDISDGIWNQRQMTFKYGYKNEYFREGGLSEPEMFQNMLNTLDTIAEPFCMMGITISMHSPFDRYNTKHLSLPEHTPYWLGEYMECLYLTDSCFGIFWNKIKNTEILQNSTVVITGDHTVFKRNMLQDFSKFSPNVPSEESYTPLIIYSPKINGNIKITDTCLQMDIYPTIMHLIGCEDYYWKGFGVNLLDSTTLHNRIVSELEAYELSDKLIRSNYFSTDYQKRDDQNYIAHAGGCIDGFKYTNSLEAVNNALRLNYKYVELDFELTSDSQLVATHGWGNWKYTPTYNEFMAKKIYDRFTPLDAYRIDSILFANPDLNLVTDRISDPEIIDKHFSKYRERIWIECFSDDDYFTLKKLGYNVLRSEWPPTNAETRNHLLKHFSFRDFRIKNYTFAGFGGNYKKSHGDCFAIFGDANIHIKDADKQFANDKRIKFVYVDFLE